MKESEVIEKGVHTLQECLSVIPGIEVEILKGTLIDTELDYCVKVKSENYEQIIYVEIKAQGHPKSARTAVNSLLRFRYDRSVYGIFIAPFISKQSAAICDTAGVGWIDLSGNCKIAFQNIFIQRENFPNKFRKKPSLSSLFFPRSERILRVLLTYPYKTWKTLNLAEEAKVSPGMITHVRRKLDEGEWIETTRDGFYLKEPNHLLRSWAESYSIKKSDLRDFYSMKPVSVLEHEISEYCRNTELPYALTGFSAANRLAPMVRNQRAQIYVGKDIEELAKNVGLKPVNSGANVSLIIPYDEGVFWNTSCVDDIQIAIPIQVYLDLVKDRGRGEEAAEFLYQRVIEVSWQQQKSIMTGSS